MEVSSTSRRLSGVRESENDGQPQFINHRTPVDSPVVQKRALTASRISVKKDESTSIERQEEITAAKVEQLGARLVGGVRDENVSATKVNPFRRRQLGPWLRDRPDEFDVLIFWRMDRAVRSMRDLHLLIEWAREKRKEIVFCEGPGSEYRFDFSEAEDDGSQDMAVIFATVISWAAKLEARAISERVKSSHKWLREHGEWGGGVMPYGLMPERVDGQKRGWRLVHNPDTIEVLEEIIGRVIEGEKLLPICRDLNERGVLTPRDYWDKVKGRERDTRRRWSTNSLKLILRSRALLGEWIYDGELNVDSDGEPIDRCEPITDRTQWGDLQAALDALSMGEKQKYSEENPLLGAAFCPRCGLPYYLKQDKQKGRVYTSLSCSSRSGDQHETCHQPTVSLLYALEITTQITLMQIGHYEVMRRVYVPGDDQSEEKARLENRIRDLEEEYDTRSSMTKDRYRQRMSGLEAKLKKIGANPVREASFKWVGTGTTYEQAWSSMDAAGRLKLLSDLGIRVYIGRGEGPAADQALRDLGEIGVSHRMSVVLDESQTDKLIAGVQDGSRVPKGLRVWYLQTAEAPVHELVTHNRVNAP